MLSNFALREHTTTTKLYGMHYNNIKQISKTFNIASS